MADVKWYEKPDLPSVTGTDRLLVFDEESETTRTVTVSTLMSTATQQVLCDEASATIAYIGKAAAGVSTATAGWQIRRVHPTDPNAPVLWADGDQLYNNVWDNRASLTYL